MGSVFLDPLESRDTVAWRALSKDFLKNLDEDIVDVLDKDVDNVNTL